MFGLVLTSGFQPMGLLAFSLGLAKINNKNIKRYKGKNGSNC